MATNYSTATAAETPRLTALFKRREDADSAYEWLLKNGYTSDDIHLLMSEETRQKYHFAEAIEPGTAEEETIVGLEAGVAVGGGLGAALGIVAAIGAAVIIPGIGPGIGMAVAGPLAASLAGAGGLVGGALGALYGSSVPEEEAQKLEQKIREGSILISVRSHSDEDADLIESAWRERGGELVQY
jgi:hypothetical protein